MSKSIAAEYQAQPWIMEPGALKAFAERVSAMPENAGILAVRIEKKLRVLNVAGGVAKIRIDGYLLDSVPDWMRLWGIGATGYDEIVEQVSEAVSREDVTAIELAVDSPGGMVAGVISASDAIFAARQAKPVTAVVNNLSASGAYWLTSQAEKITASDANALAGSIGVYTWFVDWTGYENKEGIKVIVIRSGEHKGMGLDSITDNQIAAVQEYIDDTAGNFIDQVTRGRGVEKKQIRELATGQLWIAEKAKRMGLIDSVNASVTRQNNNDIKGDIVMDQNEIEKQKIEAEKRQADVEKAKAQERARIKELSEEFADDPGFAMKASAEGWTLAEAKAEYCNVLRDRLKNQSSGGNRKSQTDNGAEPLKSEMTDDGSGGDFMGQAKELAEKKGISLTQAMKRIARSRPQLHSEFLVKSEERGKAGYAEAV